MKTHYQDSLRRRPGPARWKKIDKLCTLTCSQCFRLCVYDWGDKWRQSKSFTRGGGIHKFITGERNQLKRVFGGRVLTLHWRHLLNHLNLELRWRWLGVGCVAHFRLYPLGQVAARVLAQMVLSVEALATLRANVRFLTGVDHKVQVQMLLALESLHAHWADERPLRVVALLVPV